MTATARGRGRPKIKRPRVTKGQTWRSKYDPHRSHLTTVRRKDTPGACPRHPWTWVLVDDAGKETTVREDSLHRRFELVAEGSDA